MDYDCIAKKFQEYLNRIKEIGEDRCWICKRTLDELRNDFYESKKNPPKGTEEIDLDDILLLSYKTKHPICFNCYYTIRQDPELIKEIADKPEDEVWC